MSPAAAVIVAFAIGTAIGLAAYREYLRQKDDKYERAGGIIFPISRPPPFAFRCKEGREMFAIELECHAATMRGDQAALNERLEALRAAAKAMGVALGGTVIINDRRVKP